MLTLKNFINIEGKEFQLSSGNKFLIGIAKDEGEHYTFGVFPILENDVPSIKDVIVYKLYKDILYGGDYYHGYWLESPKMKRIVKVKPENLTLKNFILELHIQTGMICSQ
jgi:hypothetical protein